MRIGGWAPWRALIWVWAPAVALAVGGAAAYAYLGGSTMGREAQLRDDVEKLEQENHELASLRDEAAREMEEVAELRDNLDYLHGDVFSSLERRLTALMRAVGDATRQAGLGPSRFSYDVDEHEKTGLYQFGITFAVTGEFDQIERLLSAFDSSAQFLIVDQLRLNGEEEARSHQLDIGIHVSTHLVSADRDLIEALMDAAKTGEVARGSD